MKKALTGGGPNASQRITNLIAELGDWRGKVLARLREVILDAAPDITEEWKWVVRCGQTRAWSAAPVLSKTM